MRQIHATVACHVGVGLDQRHLRQNVLVRTQDVEQPDQDKLVVRPRISPQLDAVTAFAEFEQAEVLAAHRCDIFRTGEVEPVRTDLVMFGRTRLQ
ncbi:hypothetical protein [Bradyrhizobium sp. ORS 111]|uniref:hypothetical protein n=1 Tax=Bradyrhizobium sp. ORS 111 TaxID=1685958 RepID=UPI0038911396